MSKRKLSVAATVGLVALVLGLSSWVLTRSVEAQRRRQGSIRPSESDAALRERANRIHRDAIVIDTHNDVTSTILDDGFDMGADGRSGNTKTHTDNSRLKAGGIDAQFFAIYVGKEFVNKSAADGGGAARRALD
ncbi:MAG: membrane dipeptidase, partial [Acidobacteriota bacterium]